MNPDLERFARNRQAEPDAVGAHDPHAARPPSARHLLMRAAELSTARAARRVLVLENPSLRGTTYIINSLYAGLQVGSSM